MKKVLSNVLMISAMFIFASCGGNESSNSNDSAEIQPADPPITFKSFGSRLYKDVPLDGCFEVQKVSAEIVPGEENGSIGYKQINVTMKIKLLKAYPTKIQSNLYATIQLLNENEAVIEQISVDTDPILGLLEGGVGIITGSTEEEEGRSVEEKFSKVKYIRLAEVTAGVLNKMHKESDDFSSENSEESSGSLEDIANSQMKEAERIANKQMQDAQEQAKKMLGF